MATTRLQMQTAIYEILQKEATAYGLLTPTKVNNTIQDSLDWIAATMLSNNSMWNQQIVYLDINADTVIQDLTYVAAHAINASQGLTITYTTDVNPLTVTLSGYVLTVKLQTGVSTALDVKTAVDAYFAANLPSLVTITISGTSGTVQVATTAKTVDPAVALPADCAMINFVKKKSPVNDDMYIELEYKETNKETINTDPIENGQANTQSYMIINNKIFMEPTPSITVLNGIRLSYLAYPTDLSGDGSTISGDLSGKPFLQLCKWRSARILYQMSNDGTPLWAQNEGEWFQICQKIIGKRVAMPVIVPGVQNY
jgi:hypothetical protein